MIGLPPVEAGALKVIEAWALPAVAVAPVGAPGTPMGVTALEADDAVLVPTAFTAYTAKVYEVPLARPETTMGAPDETPIRSPGVEEAR